jgi:hypothetical protein
MRGVSLAVAIMFLAGCLHSPGTLAQEDKEPPVISEIEVHLIGETWFTISWRTDEPAQGGVEWGLGADLDQVQDEEVSTLRTDHHLNVTGLSRGTNHFVRVFATDESNNTGYSGTWQLGTFPIGVDEWFLGTWGWYIALVVVLVTLIVGLSVWYHLRDRGNPR